VRPETHPPDRPPAPTAAAWEAAAAGAALSSATLALGEHMVPALLGVDALYRSESGDDTGLAVLNMDTEGRFAPEGFAGYGAARARLRTLREEAATLPEPDRRAYYDDLCASTIAFIDWRLRGLPFREQLAAFLHVPAEPASDGELDALRREMSDLLDLMGYRGDLKERCATWEARNRVPADEVPGVLAELLSRAWDLTEEHLLPIPAPKSDGMRVVPVSGVAFNARCSYLHRNVELNVDPVLTLPGLKHLALHEGYPGHYVQFRLRETLFREGGAAADGLLSLVNSASSCVFEGLGDIGLEMLGWVESDDDRLQALLTRHRAGIGTGAAWRLHALGWPAEAVRDWLQEQALVGGEGWVANRMGFIQDPARAVLIWSYWWGEPVVARAWRAVAPERRPAFLRFLHGRMHSNTSVGMFQG
jgi:hypothetical protein